MKRGLSLGSTALFFFLLGIAAWLKSGGHMVDTMNVNLAFTENDSENLKILTDHLRSEEVQDSWKLSDYAGNVSHISFGLGLLFTVFWFIQRRRIAIDSREESLMKNKRHPSPTIHRQRCRR